jgi:BirA family biotin operon repressor/biotin-[acetyl-CoA-carboxylase] ligase
VITGIAEDVDPDGRLLLLEPAGHRRAVAAGDVVHLRPGD